MPSLDAQALKPLEKKRLISHMRRRKMELSGRSTNMLRLPSWTSLGIERFGKGMRMSIALYDYGQRSPPSLHAVSWPAHVDTSLGASEESL